MTMRSPIAALLWENWRLTQLETVYRLVLGLVVCAAVLVGSGVFAPAGDEGARVALMLLIVVHAPLSLSVAKLNGGRFLDGYRPGFPYYFLFARPVRTAVMVAAPIAYHTMVAVALYLVSALLLRAIFGYPFPLLSFAAWMAAFHIVQWAVQWASRNKVVQWLGSMTVGVAFTVLAVLRTSDWPARFDFWLVDYVLLFAACVMALGLAVAGVARQRHGDAAEAAPRAAERGGFSEWLVRLFPLPCPSTSATRAQLWFELKSSGIPALTIGLAVAAPLPLLFALGDAVDAVMPFAVLFTVFAVLAILSLCRNPFGVRRKQGARYITGFDATQACGTARLVGLKVLVRTVCALIALVAVGASTWASSSLVTGSGENGQGFVQIRAFIEAAVRGLSGSAVAAIAVVTGTGLAAVVAMLGAIEALRARYPRRLTVAGGLLLLHAVAIVLIGMLEPVENTPALLLAIARGTFWVAAAAVALATVYLFAASSAEGLLTLRQAGVIVAFAAASGVAWVTLRQAAHVGATSATATEAALLSLPTVLILTVGVLAPWSFSRVRHT